ncbi:MAG: hypothetical protein KGJ30_20385, partial [Burkholderiales bacterium]|nr:hypothetical protein [Burkholderiales bacterium]
WLRDSARPGALDDACATAATTVLALIGVGRLDEAQDRLGPPPAGGAHENHWQRAQQHQFARMRLLCARGAYAQACELAEAELGQVRSHACEPLYELRMYDCLRQARSALGDAAGALRAAVKARQACIPVLRLSSRARYLAAQLQAGGAAALSAIDLQRLDAVDQAVRAQPEPPPVPPPQPPRHPPEAPPEAPPGPPGPRVPPFVAHVVHELRTPIGGVVGMASLLMMSGLDEKQRRYAKLMQGSAQTLMLLVNDILDLAKLERGQFTLDPREADFGAWIGATLDPFVELAALKGLRLDSSVDAGLPARLVFDELRLRQVVSNLLSNAVKFTRRGGVRLDVARRAVAPNGRVGLRFEVADTGVGLTAEALGRLFQEFVQADASVAREHGGSGLGLALSKQLVERMGGRIGGESEPGVGSRFWFEVDLAAAAPVACIEAAAAR